MTQQVVEVRYLISDLEDSLTATRALRGPMMMALYLKDASQQVSVTTHRGTAPPLLPMSGVLHFSGPCHLCAMFGHHTRSCSDHNNHVYLADFVNVGISSLSLFGL